MVDFSQGSDISRSNTRIGVEEGCLPDQPGGIIPPHHLLVWYYRGQLPRHRAAILKLSSVANANIHLSHDAPTKRLLTSLLHQSQLPRRPRTPDPRQDGSADTHDSSITNPSLSTSPVARTRPNRPTSIPANYLPYLTLRHANTMVDLLPLVLDLDLNTANLNLPKLAPFLSRLSSVLAQQIEDENQLLNGIWIGLLSVEALMVLGVMVRGLFRGVASSRWFGASESVSSSQCELGHHWRRT